MHQKSIQNPPPPAAQNRPPAFHWPRGFNRPPAFNQSAAFNLLPWRDWRQAKRRARQQAILVGGCALALLPAGWLQAQHQSIRAGLMLEHEQRQAGNRAASLQLATLSEHHRVIDDWLAGIAAGHRHAGRWSALAYLLRESAAAPVIEKLSLSNGRLTFSGHTTDVADLTVSEARWRSAFASEYTLQEIRGQHGTFHFQVDAPWEIAPWESDSGAVLLFEGPDES